MKLEMKISERDKKLLILLFSVMVIAAAYYFGYNKIVEQTSQYETEIISLRSKKNDLTSKIANQQKYIADTAAYQQEFDMVLKNYAGGTTQPSSIAFLNNVETLTGTWIKSVSFANPTAIYNFGNNAASNPSGNGGTAYVTDMVGYKTTLTMAYEAEYDEWKNLIKYINEYSSKNTIDNITMTYNDADGTVSGVITVSLYSVSGTDRTFTEPEFDVLTGTDNIFDTE